jgi:hypothetical protein
MAFSDRELLARTLQAEAGNQGRSGMLAAGSVIMNRAQTSGYGDGVRGVIMKPGQFSAWNSVTGYAGGEQGQDMAAMTPSGDAYSAADALIGGQYSDPTGGATHYYNPSISQPSWGIGNGGDWARIGDHVFGNADAGRGNTPARASTRNAQPPNARNAPTGGILSNEGNQMAQPQQPQRPQGLLGSLGIQRRDPNAQGETSQPFYNRQSFGDTLARLAPALGRMGVMGLEGPMQAQLDTRNQRQGDERARAAQAGRVNQTIAWMRTQPNGEQFAAMAEQVGIEPAMQAMQAANAAPSRTSAMQNYEFMLAQGMDPSTAMERAFSGGTNIQVGPDGQPAAQIGTISPGYQAIPDGDGGYTMSPIPGGPADTDLGELADKADASAESNAAGSINVLEKVNAVRAEVAANPFASGLLGAIAGNIPGTGAYDTAQTAGTIKANLGFDRLTQMRAESPTGGALGSVSQMELDRLESTIASLDLGQSRDQILRNLDDIERQYTRILENAYSTGDPTALDAILGGRPSFMGGNAEPSDDDLLRQYGGN